MSAELHCSQELLLQADFDGELDAAESASLQAHLQSCAICGRREIDLAREPRFHRVMLARCDVDQVGFRTHRSDVIVDDALGEVRGRSADHEERQEARGQRTEPGAAD
jgi:anti-sigma factor RsiW